MYPTAVEVRTLEKRTLRCITEISEFGRLPELRSAASSQVSKIDEYRGPLNIHLGFILDIPDDRASRALPRRVDIGALVEVAQDQKSITNASYSLVICRKADPAKSSILRKLHFDYEPIAFRKAEPKPSMHMQVCGLLSRHHIAAGYRELSLQALYPWFEKPRVPSPPTSVALLLNWLLLEFQSDLAAQNILKNPRWRVLVAEAERQLLRPYYESAARFLKSAADRDKRFLQNHLYEMVVD
jgi:hypothetical protein